MTAIANMNRIRKVEQFDLKHGQDAVYVESDDRAKVNSVQGRLLFGDGATRDVHILGTQYEPPKDRQELRRLRGLYLDIKNNLLTNQIESSRVNSTYFNLRHGNDAILVQGTMIYSDGASRDFDARGPRLEPPFDRERRYTLRVMYYEELLSQASQEFADFRHGVIGRANANMQEKYPTQPPPDQKAALAHLRKLKDNVRYFQVFVNELREMLDEAKPDWRKEQEKFAQQNRAKNEEFLAAVSTVRI